jgi:plastocyanin
LKRFPILLLAVAVTAGATDLAGVRAARSTPASRPASQASNAPATTYYVFAAGGGPIGGGVSQDSLAAFLPSTLTIHSGDSVVWLGGDHTVTFGPEAERSYLEHHVILTRKRADGRVTRYLNPRVANPSGGSRYGGSGFVSSGVLSRRWALGLPPFRLTFTKPGTYDYDCLLHSQMDGTIVVLPRPSSPPNSSIVLPSRVIKLTVTLGHVRMAGTLSPAIAGTNTVHLWWPGKTERESKRASLHFTATMPGMAMSPTQSVLRPGAQGYEGAVWLPMFGDYRVRITLISVPRPISSTLALSLRLPSSVEHEVSDAGLGRNTRRSD